ncbi:MAG: hypothetical protein JWM91_691 [Rhodospirillales bacterium]|nr:hypothetical protein [Rhodospirillales bacterium]
MIPLRVVRIPAWHQIVRLEATGDALLGFHKRSEILVGVCFGEPSSDISVPHRLTIKTPGPAVFDQKEAGCRISEICKPMAEIVRLVTAAGFF